MIPRDKASMQRVLNFVEKEHFRHRRDFDARPAGDEIDLSEGVALRLLALKTPLTSQMLRDFTAFLHQCMAVQVNRKARIKITFRLKPAAGIKRETFKLEIRKDRILIDALHERGLLHAAHYLEHLMARRGGPFISLGKEERFRRFDPYISQPVFQGSDANLSLMSHFGVNGLWRTVSLWACCQSRVLPELNHPKYDEFIGSIRDLARRAAVYGMDLYLDISSWSGLDAGHPVFRNHPDVRGAQFYYAVKDYQLCSSNRRVRQCYQESFANLFKKVPELGGINLIVGGEGLLHCFTRPKPPLHGGTNCPHCCGHDPSRDVSRLVNGIAAAIHKVNSRARIFVWPYSAHLWSGKQDPAQTGFIRRLRKDICLLSNFETPLHLHRNGADAWICDYNIINIGPSKQYLMQSRALAEKGMPHYAKTESASTVFFIFMPYLPVPYRWCDRFKQLRASGAPGILAKWNHYGFTGSIPEELLYHATWTRTPRCDRILAELARRDFGRQADIKLILKAWRVFSEIWGQIPKSHVMFGERSGYFKGPFWLGPAHPMIFNVQNHYSLSHKFTGAKIGNIFDQPAWTTHDTPHKYSSDLLFTYPFTPGWVESALRKVIRGWDSGLALLEQAIGADPTPRAIMESDVCAALSIYFHSVYNVIKFYRARDKLFTGKGNVHGLLLKKQGLLDIINAEIANAESMLPIIKRNPLIGYCFAGRVIDAGMIKEKVRQCIFVRDLEIPNLTRQLLLFNYAGFLLPEDQLPAQPGRNGISCQ